MKKGYWVVAYRSISDAEALRNYAALALPAVAAHGGQAIIRTSDAVVPHEFGLMERVVVIEYDSFAKAQEAYESEAYKLALAALGNAADRDFRIVEGL